MLTLSVILTGLIIAGCAIGALIWMACPSDDDVRELMEIWRERRQDR